MVFAKFFKPKWQHKNSTIRREAIALLDPKDDEQRTTLAALAKEDPDIGVRSAAISRLIDLNTLYHFATQEQISSLRYTALARLKSLVSDLINDPQELRSWIDWISSVTEPEILLHAINCSKHDELSLAALANVQDPTQLQKIALHNNFARVRQAAISAIADPTLLENIESKTRGKDKKINRIAREKLQTYKQAALQEQQIQQQREQLCDAIEQHARKVYCPLYAEKRNYLQTQWTQLAVPDQDPLAQRFYSANKLCLDKIQDHAAEQQAKPAATAHLQQARETICATLEQTYSKLSDASAALSVTSLDELLTDLATQWQELTKTQPATKQERDRYRKITKALQSYQLACQKLDAALPELQTLHTQTQSIDSLDKPHLEQLHKQTKDHLQQINWPVAISLPPALTQLQDQLTSIHAQLQTIKQRKSADITTLKNQIAEIDTLLEQGAIQASDQHLKKTQQALKLLPPSKTRNRLQAQLSRQFQQIKQLRDWQGFATTPKKQTLCEQMEQLIGSAVPPEDLANDIKHLQDEWKALGPADRNLDGKLWRRFKHAADQAYEPCKVHFAQQRENRKANLIKREQLCTELTQFYAQADWSNIDWKQVIDLRKRIHQRWKEYAPVERTEGKRVQLLFKQAMDPIQTKLEEEFHRNHLTQRAIIKQAEALIDDTDIAASIEKAKQLQQQWKNIGVVNAGTNRTHWTKFRTACDAIFNRRAEQNKQRNEQNDAVLAQAEQLCKKLEDINAGTQADLVSAKGTVNQLQETFDALNGLPKGHGNSIKKRFNSAIQTYHTNVAAFETQKSVAQRAEVLRKADICAALERIVQSGAFDDTQTVQALIDDWSGELEVPPAIQTAMQQRFECACTAFHDRDGEALQVRVEDNDKNARILCIRSEILAQIASPETDQDLRMEYQISQLSQSMLGGAAQQQDSTLAQAEQLLLDWCCTGPLSEPQASMFKQRLHNAITQLGLL